jgi:hypothetical protein
MTAGLAGRSRGSHHKSTLFSEDSDPSVCKDSMYQRAESALGNVIVGDGADEKVDDLVPVLQAARPPEELPAVFFAKSCRLCLL